MIYTNIWNDYVLIMPWGVYNYKSRSPEIILSNIF